MTNAKRRTVGPILSLSDLIKLNLVMVMTTVHTETMKIRLSSQPLMIQFWMMSKSPPNQEHTEESERAI